MIKKLFLSIFIVSLMGLLINFYNPNLFIKNTFAQSSTDLENPGILPDNNFYFLKIWKEQIQLFFTFNAQKKAKKYLHLSEVRLAEYQKMIEKNKPEIAQKSLEKYQKQLNLALENMEKTRNKGKDISDLVQKVTTATTKHIQVLQQVLAKNPEQAQKGLTNALESSQKGYLKALNAIQKQKGENNSSNNNSKSNSNSKCETCSK